MGACAVRGEVWDVICETLNYNEGGGFLCEGGNCRFIPAQVHLVSMDEEFLRDPSVFEWSA